MVVIKPNYFSKDPWGRISDAEIEFDVENSQIVRLRAKDDKNELRRFRSISKNLKNRTTIFCWRTFLLQTEELLPFVKVVI